MSESPRSLYDKDDYYLENARGSRLSPALDGLLDLIEWERVFSVGRMLRTKGGAILDVGAGDGRFLHLMRRRYGVRPVGTTASERSAQGAANSFSIRLHVTEELAEPSAEAPFAMITYWHVFEHLRQPQNHISKWHSLLEEGGLLVVEVPNIASIGARLRYQSWLGSDPVHHINHVPPAQLRELIEGAGLRVVGIDHFSLKFSFVFLWSALLGWLFRGLYDFDSIMDVLKRPMARLREAPLATFNAMASVGYLAPVVLTLMLAGVLLRQGEVVRVFARK